MVSYLWENLFRREARESDLIHVLSNHFLFEPLSKKELHIVKEVLHLRNFRPGEVVFRQGEVGIGMYIIVRGAVDISIEDLQNEKEEEQSSFVTRLSSGDFFGELSLVEDNGRRTATARAADETLLLGFYKPDLQEIISRNPSTGSKILLRLAEVLGKRLKETSHRITELKREINQLTETQPS